MVDVPGRSELIALVGHELLMGRVSITTQCTGFYTSSVAHSDIRFESIVCSLRLDAQRGEKPLDSYPGACVIATCQLFSRDVEYS